MVEALVIVEVNDYVFGVLSYVMILRNDTNSVFLKHVLFSLAGILLLKAILKENHY